MVTTEFFEPGPEEPEEPEEPQRPRSRVREALRRLVQPVVERASRTSNVGNQHGAGMNRFGDRLEYRLTARAQRDDLRRAGELFLRSRPEPTGSKPSPSMEDVAIQRAVNIFTALDKTRLRGRLSLKGN